MLAIFLSLIFITNCTMVKSINGAITDEYQRDLGIPLSFLASEKQYKVTIYSDGPNTDWETNPTETIIASYLGNNDSVIPANLAKGGGMALHISPANSNDLENLNFLN